METVQKQHNNDEGEGTEAVAARRRRGGGDSSREVPRTFVQLENRRILDNICG